MKNLLFFIAMIPLTLASCQIQTTNEEQVLPPAVYQEKLQAEEKVQLLDVRTPKEYADGHIEGAVNIDYFEEDFLQQVEQRFDKNKPVMLYCRSGNRSAKATAIMEEAGFTKVYDLEGGFMAWPKD